MKKKDHPAYACWKAMLSRCRNPKNPSWKYCGGKGVKVCPQWRDFWQFAADMGPRPSMQHSLDRFPDGSGNYEPGNVRWATAAQQQNNTCKLRSIDRDGKKEKIGRETFTMVMADLCQMGKKRLGAAQGNSDA